MANILLIIIILLALTFIVIAIYRSPVIAGRSDKQEDTDNGVGDKDTLFAKQMCTGCKTGKYTYELDPDSETCPYIGCWQRNKCPFYKPLEKKPKNESLGKHNKDYQQNKRL